MSWEKDCRSVVLEAERCENAKAYFKRHKIKYTPHPSTPNWLILHEISEHILTQACKELKSSGWYDEQYKRGCIGRFGKYK